MSDPILRRIPWNFDGVKFIWNPDQPFFSVAMNKVSFLAAGFEKYICRTIDAAEPPITDPAVLAEVRAFRAQEGLHAMAHRKHVKALIETYPGLPQALDKTIALYDDQFEAKELKYHLGYVGGLESIFTPNFKVLIDNRATLFAGGDTRVSSLLLWHFCEEIEHRSSGLIVYDHVVMTTLGEEFANCVHDAPPEILSARQSGINIPRRDKLKSAFGILMSQMPWHNPEHQLLPKYFDEWNERFDRGEDMKTTYGQGSIIQSVQAA
ncbi:MAG: metal-dependent hydrolase [Novosphingobium sp.]|nr:metal-dependent hydrolase [Novosphingobium sp.]